MNLSLKIIFIFNRLRAVQCPSDMIDQIGGWSTAGVGQGYGEGYEIETLSAWLERLCETSFLTDCVKNS